MTLSYDLAWEYHDTCLRCPRRRDFDVGNTDRCLYPEGRRDPLVILLPLFLYTGNSQVFRSRNIAQRGRRHWAATRGSSVARSADLEVSENDSLRRLSRLFQRSLHNWSRAALSASGSNMDSTCHFCMAHGPPRGDGLASRGSVVPEEGPSRATEDRLTIHAQGMSSLDKKKIRLMLRPRRPGGRLCRRQQM